MKFALKTLAPKLFTLGLMAAAAQPVLAVTTFWDATADYSTATNTGVNGVWSYGQSASLNGALTLLPANGIVAGTTGLLNAWQTNVGDVVPGFGKSGASGFTGFSTVKILADTLWMHPIAAVDSYVVLAFTAPSAGQYQVDASFWSEDSRLSGGTTDVHIGNAANSLLNSVVSLGYMAPPASYPTFSGLVNLAANETLYFSVGAGAETGSTRHNWDSTGLQATVAAVPEPGELAMMLSGLTLVGLVVRRKRGKVTATQAA
jgi:hypothetical protein